MEQPRLLMPEEIDVRVGTSSKTKPVASFLLYKDARCDMSILDEMVGPLGWMREHLIRENVINGQRTMVNYCKVSIWDESKNCWVSKEDVGTESNTENAKGESSDSFKRACVNWGIGRELYSAPQIWINLTDKEFNSGKPRVDFSVEHITYENKQISELRIIDADLNVRYEFKNGRGKSMLPGLSGSSKKSSDTSAEEEASKEFSKCKTQQDMTFVWNKYPQFHEENGIFWNAYVKRANEIRVKK